MGSSPVTRDPRAAEGSPRRLPLSLPYHRRVTLPPTNAACLREFHRAVGLIAPQRPTVPGLVLLTLRRTLISEEVGEVEAE